MPTTFTGLSDEQVRYLRPIYDHFHRESSWPLLRNLQHALFKMDGRTSLSLAKLIDEVPRAIVLHEWSSDEVSLSALGIWAIAGPDVQELQDLMQLVQFAIDRYRDDPNGTVSSGDMLGRGLSAARVKRLYLLVRHEPLLLGGGHSNGDDWERSLSDEIWRLGDVRNVSDYFVESDRLPQSLAQSIGEAGGVPDWKDPLKRLWEIRVSEKQFGLRPTSRRQQLADWLTRNRPRFEVTAFYLWVQDEFSQAWLMSEEIPIRGDNTPGHGGVFELINGWTIEPQALARLKNGPLYSEGNLLVPTGDSRAWRFVEDHSVLITLSGWASGLLGATYLIWSLVF